MNTAKGLQSEDALAERTTTSAGSIPPQLTAAVTAYSQDLIELCVRFLLSAGISRSDAAAALTVVAESALEGDLQHAPSDDCLWVQLSDTIAMWRRDATYLDDSGRPRPVPDAGPDPSIEALLSRTVDPSLHDAARALLRRTAATERDGFWHFTAGDGSLSLSGLESVHRLLLTIGGLLRTFVENQCRVGDPVLLKNFDSAAHTVAFPLGLIPELRARVHKQLHVVLDDLDIWMTAAAKHHRDGPVAHVGVAAFMYASTPRGGGDSRSNTTEAHPATHRSGER